MTQKGYPSLVAKTADLGSESSLTGGRPAVARYGKLHVITTDRRRPNRAVIPRTIPTLPPGGRPYELAKRGLDIVGAITALVIFSPLFLVIVGFARASGGSALFRHRRVGQGGKVFECLKFRTMVPNAEEVLQNLLDSDREIKEEWLRYHKLRNDPRVTLIGRFLRKTSLDELPQLWNVLRGEMSLVGPRPIVPDELRRYGHKVETFLSARPGITGLWQISGRNDTDYRRRVALDICYVKSRCLVLDLVILLKTLPAVFARSGAY
jgi:lipopolysaccharide/colanic/teichoic acid biosynthesis glycosyltransferase